MENIFDILKERGYIGRGIIIGEDNNNNKVVSYFITGRSANSQNRVFKKTEDGIIIYPFDENKVEDPSLIIYSPIRKYKNSLIVTNGDQTDTIYEFLNNDKTFEEALETRTFEPDNPNYTPRISGIINFDENSYKENIVKCIDAQNQTAERITYNFEFKKGTGHFISTYNKDGNPLPTFSTSPVEIKLEDDLEEYSSKLWDALANEYKISLFVGYYDKNGNETYKIFNKNK